MNTEQKKAAPAAKVPEASPDKGAYITTPIEAATISFVEPDKARRFLVISGRGPRGDSATLVFAKSGTPECWIQVSELSGIVEPQHAVTSFLLSPHWAGTMIDNLKRELELSRRAYWKLFNEKRRASKSEPKKTKRS